MRLPFVTSMRSDLYFSLQMHSICFAILGFRNKTAGFEVLEDHAQFRLAHICTQAQCCLANAWLLTHSSNDFPLLRNQDAHDQCEALILTQLRSFCLELLKDIALRQVVAN